MYMIMSRDQNAGRIHGVWMDNNTSEKVESLNIWQKIIQIKFLSE